MRSAVRNGRRAKKGYASRMEGYACVCARIRHPCRMGAYAPVWGEGARTGPSWSEFAPKDWKPAQISNHASIMRPMRMRPTRIRHPQRMAEIRMALLRPHRIDLRCLASKRLGRCVPWPRLGLRAKRAIQRRSSASEGPPRARVCPQPARNG